MALMPVLSASRWRTWTAAAWSAALMSACHSSAPDPAASGSAYSVGGQVQGLAGPLVLSNHGVDLLSIQYNGPFIFANPLPAGASYDIKVALQSPLQQCTVQAGAGTMTAADITDVQVRCALRRFSLGGTISGNIGPISLRDGDQGTAAVRLLAPGPFTFPQDRPAGSVYDIVADGLGHLCTVVGGRGTLVDRDIDGVQVLCTPQAYALGGKVSGLTPGQQVKVAAGDQQLSLTANGAFTFARPLTYLMPIALSVVVQPQQQRCSFSASSVAAQMGAQAMLDAQLLCVPYVRDSFTIGGIISGATGALTITDATFGQASAAGSGTFRLPNARPAGSAYALSVSTPPAGQSCTLTRGSGSMAAADVSNVVVSCTTRQHLLGGTLSGLRPAGQLQVTQGSQPPLLLNSNGPFALGSTVAVGSSKQLSIVAQPVGQKCSIVQGADPMPDADELGSAISCRAFLRLSSGHLAAVALGQPDLVGPAYGMPGAQILARPSGLWSTAAGRLYIADWGFSRVLSFATLPAASFASAAAVIGQPDFATVQAPGGGGLCDSVSDVGGDGAGFAMVAQRSHRVLVWDADPTLGGPPSRALGQPNLVATGPSCSAAGLQRPTSISVHGSVWAVADTDNHRVLVWRTRPTSSGQAADLVLGQPNLTTCASGPVGPSTLQSPQGVWTDGVRLVVADTGHRRLLGWQDIGSIGHGAPASWVLGQPDMLHDAARTDLQRSVGQPVRVLVVNDQVWASDAAGSRIVGFDQLPVVADPPIDRALGTFSTAVVPGCNFGMGPDAAAANGSLCQPQGLQAVGDDLWVADAGNRRVLVYISD